MKTFKFINFAFAVVFVIGCANNSPTDLQDNTIADVVTYQNTVKGIIDANCISCHGTVPTPGTPMSLTTYENVRASVLNLGAINRINRNPGDIQMMPLGPTKLPQAKIDAIVKWQTQGLQQ